jgi:hypothetical protein
MKKSIFFLLLFITTGGFAQTKDWPQACYNEVSMWVTAACKEYVETVYYPSLTTTTDTNPTEPVSTEITFLAGPAPVFGGGIVGLILLVVVGRRVIKTLDRDPQ